MHCLLINNGGPNAISSSFCDRVNHFHFCDKMNPSILLTNEGKHKRPGIMLHGPIQVSHRDQRFCLPRFWTRGGAHRQGTSL